jgi:hypothetical protein
MKLFGLTFISAAMADVTQYKDKNGNLITIDPGCPTLWPKNQDPDTLLPYWKKECPPLDLCYPNIAQNVGTKPYNARCKDADGNKVTSEDCCSAGWEKQSTCYGKCEWGTAGNFDGKNKFSWKCVCSKAKGCFWDIQGNGYNDMECVTCPAINKIDWTTSGKKQADFNEQPTALGVNGRILVAGWIHKNADNNWAADGNYHIILSIQGVALELEHIMAWDYDVEHVYSEDYGANQWYTFAQTLIVLTPNSASPQGPWEAGEQTDILIGIENADDFTQANLDEKRIAYSVGVMYNKFESDGVTPINLGCVLSHVGANPVKNDMALTNQLGHPEL